MNQADHILQQIERLPAAERSYLRQQLQRRMERAEMLRQTLDRIIGSGAGLWHRNAQDWVNESRADER